MAKRGATSELNKDNWDQEDEPEEAGHYTIASDQEIQNRKIRRAKRSLPTMDNGEKKSAFTGFGGFGKSNKFSLNNSGDEDPFEKFKQNGCNQSTSNEFDTESGKESMKKFTPLASSKVEEKSRDTRYFQNLKKLNETFIHWVQDHMNRNPFCNFTPVCKDYQEHINKLDNMFPSRESPKIASGISSTSFKIPTFSSVKPSSTLADSSADSIAKCGFSNFLKTQQDFKPSNFDQSEMSYGAGFKSNTTNTSTVSFGRKVAAKTETSTGSPCGPSFSQGTLGNNENKTENKSEPFQFGIQSPASKNFSFETPTFESDKGNQGDGRKQFDTIESSSTFQFKPNTSFFSNTNEPFKFSAAASSVDPSTFSFGTKAVAPLDQQTDVNEEYIPPKNENAGVVEEDAIYTKRCKLFFKKGESFSDSGIGLLYLKPYGDKTVLLIRNDTIIGTILLNIVLSFSMPIAKSGKNNVLLTCIPNPPLDAKNPDSKESVPVLIRVKTSEDADELLMTLKKHMS